MLVLDDAGGEPLEALLGSPMQAGRFLRLAIGVAAAVGKLHERGLVHKDIKPANILFNSTTDEVRLTGFGIASRLPRERQSPRPPETIAGTLAYMAPEQTGRMNRSIDSRSDLYALGVTFYQMLTSALPFTAADPNGMGALPLGQAAGGACRAAERDPRRRLGNRHEAAREAGRRSLPDRRRPRKRSSPLPDGVGGAAPD
jgi:serine/threonine protein kinase